MVAVPASARPRGSGQQRPSLARIFAASGVAVIVLAAIAGFVAFARGIDIHPGMLYPGRSDAEVSGHLSALGIEPAALAGTVVVVQAAVVVVAAVSSAFILARKPLTSYHIALAVSLVLFVAAGTAGMPAMAVLMPATAPGSNAIVILASTFFLSLVPLFPNGKAVPRWSLAAVVGWNVFGIVSVAVPWWTFGAGYVMAGSAFALALVATLLGTQIFRYQRVSSRVERQQSKWVVLALVVYLLTIVPVIAMPPNTLQRAAGSGGFALETAQGLLGVLLAGLLAASIGFAIAKYKLFDVDLFVSRTVVYGLLIVLIAGGYALLVAASGLAGQQSGYLPAVVAAVAVALAANPVRMALQRRVNRWLFGSRGDPYAVVRALGERLRGAREPGQVREIVLATVVRELRYPYAEITLPDGVPAASCAGTPTTQQAVGGGVRLELARDGESLGALNVSAPAGERMSAREVALLGTVAQHGALALSAALASEKVQRSREHAVRAAEDERRRLARDLHDGLGPTLAGVQQRIGTALRIGAERPEQGQALLLEAGSELSGVVDQVRRLVRGLRPPALDELGLLAALEQALADGTPAAALEGAAIPALEPATEVAAYRIAVEAVTNARRHGQAQAIRVTLSIQSDWLCLEVEDDGVGLGAGVQPGGGVRSMRERAEQLGGALELVNRKTQGTRLRARLPLAGAEGTATQEAP